MVIAYKKIATSEFRSVHDWTAAFEEVEWHTIANVNWAENYPYCPEVKFQAMHTDAHIVLHYHVTEEYVKAQYIRPNENIWEDSCVEFFISFDDRKTYYNLEFNPLGAGLIGYGSAVKTERSRLSAEQINTVSTFTAVSNMQGQKIWQVVLVIPTALFPDQEAPLSGTKAHANFYKCGDGLPNPHFISWKPIDNPTPNFHLPKYFGEIVFE